jgi:uncharacterized protein YqeY
MSQLLDQITASWKDAMRSGDAVRKETLALVRAAVKNVQIDAKEELDDAAVQVVIEKEAKKRREAALEYEKAGYADRAQKERDELAVLQDFLPSQLSDEELQAVVSETIAEVGASSAKDMGKVMGALRPKIAGRADGKVASELVKAALSQ